MTRFAVGSDHAAIALRRAIVEHLHGLGHQVSEIGPTEGERVDYPDQAVDVATRITQGEVDRGILVCGTGIGMSIAANKICGIRAALVHDPVTAALAAQHNDANVLCLGGRLMAVQYALGLVETWLGTTFETRHRPRLDKIHGLEGPG